MAEVSASLVLDLSQALAEIDQLSSDIDSATSDVSLTLDIESTVDEVQSSIDSLEAAPIDIEVDADVEAAQAEIDGLEGESVEVEVEAPGATEAAGDLEEVSTAAEGAGTQLDGASTAAAGFGAAAGAASGSAEGLLGALGGLGPAGAGAAAAIGAVAVTATGLFSAAVDSTASAQRFATVLGDMASQVDSVELGDLNLSLEEFAVMVGQDDEALRNSLTTLVAYGQASGVAADDTARYAEQITLLAGRATALNPALDIGATVDGLSRSLATGGARLGRFGLDIGTLSERQEIAQEVFGRSFESLSRYEKSVVGAEAATRNLGNSLQRDIIAGADNVQVKLQGLQQAFQNNLETLGEPLILPVFDLLEAGMPVALSVAEAFGAIARAALPLVSGYLSAIGPGFEIIAEAFSNFADQAEAAGPALEEVFAALSELAVADAEAFAAALELIAAALPLLSFDGLIAGIETLSFAVRNSGITDLADLLGGPLAKGAGEAGAQMQTLTEEETAAIAATEAFVNAAVGALPQAAAAFDDVGKAGEAFGIIDAASDPALLAANLQARADAIAAFQANLESLGQTGEDLDATLNFIATAGPEEAGSLLQNLVEGTEADRATLETSLENLETSTTGFADFLTSEGFEGGSGLGTAAAEGISANAGATVAAADAAGADTSEGLATGLGLAAALVTVQMGLATAAVAVGGISMATTGGTVGRNAGNQLSLGFLQTAPSLIGLAMSSVSLTISSASFSVASSARSAGYSIGTALGQGVSQGLSDSTRALAAQAAATVTAASAAAAAAAAIASPSKVWAEMGRQMGAGMALGLADSGSGVVAAAEALTYAAATGSLGVGAVGVGGGTATFGGVQVTVNAPGATVESAQAIGVAVRDGAEQAIAAQRLAFDAKVST